MEQLSRDGVKTYEYEPTMMHSKTMLIDDRIVAVGSSNLDALSLNKMDEGAVVVVDEKLAEEEAGRFLQDVALSLERDGAGQVRRTAVR
jgi:cardiolipin synthase